MIAPQVPDRNRTLAGELVLRAAAVAGAMLLILVLLPTLVRAAG